MTLPIRQPQAQLQDQVFPLERILATGITGSGKSFQWLRIARILKPTGSIFRVLDTDNDIDYMLRTEFQDLLPENNGNVFVHLACDWLEYEQGVAWIKQKGANEKALDQYLLHAYRKPVARKDWVVVDKINNAWSTVQRYFVNEVFGEDKGQYFLEIRKAIEAHAGISLKTGKQATSVVTEGFDGWKDWSVINGLYDDWILPIVYRVKCNVYAAADVEKIMRDEKDAEVLDIFGNAGIKPTGNKKLGGQFHSVFVLIPGFDKQKNRTYEIVTLKDRGNRTYFKGTALNSFYNQYLATKAGWPIVIE